jgi:hypothetical protein
MNDIDYIHDIDDVDNILFMMKLLSDGDDITVMETITKMDTIIEMYTRFAANNGV